MSAARAERARTPRLAWLAAWVALSAAVLLALRASPWGRAAVPLAHQDPRWALLAVALNLAILPLWTWEWVRLAPAAERPSWRRVFGVVALTSSTLNTVPFFAGEASAVVLLVAHAGLSRGGALTVLALDQLLVGVAKLATIGAAAAVAPLPGWLRGGVAALCGGVTVAAAALLLVAHARPRGAGRRGAGRPSRSWRAAATARLRAFAHHLDALREARTVATVLLLALAKKSAEVLAIVAAQHALGVALPWWSALLVVAALGVGTLVPVAPGNVGTYEATAFLVYRSLGVPSDAALGLAIVQHLYFLVPAIGTGYLLLTVRQLRPSAAPAVVVAESSSPSARR